MKPREASKIKTLVEAHHRVVSPGKAVLEHHDLISPHVSTFSTDDGPAVKALLDSLPAETRREIARFNRARLWLFLKILAKEFPDVAEVDDDEF